MKRTPIIGIRYPVTQGNNETGEQDTLLVEDSKTSEDSLGELLGEIKDFEISQPDQIHAIEDAFIKAFPSLWALKYKTIKGKPTTYISSKNPFCHRPWQQAVLDDSHPNKIVEKSRQLGLSEVGMTEVLHFLITHDTTKAMYIFPRNQQMIDFSKSRIAPVFQGSKYFQGLIDKEVNSVSTKKILNSYLFMRSGWGGALGEGADVDHLDIDEYDRLKEGVELAFQEGLKSSKWGLMRRWSTPTIPGRGINALFQKSDQMRYIHTCPHCGHKQFLTFEDNIIQVKPHGINTVTQEIEDGTFIVGCKKCKKELDRWAIGEWVAQYPSIKETRGYHISQIDAVWISADDIMRRKFNYSSKQLFYNYVIGEPYASEGLLITEEDIKASVRLPKEVLSRTNTYIAISAGIDWGDVSYMTILGIKSNGAVDLLNMYSIQDDPHQPLKSVSFFCALLRAYQPNIVVADAGYGADRNSYGYTQFPAAWYSCYWTTPKDANAKIRFKDSYNENAHEILVDKTVKIQRTLHALKGQLIGLFPWGEKIATLTLHCKNTRIMDEESDGRVYQRATRVGADHYCCALTYALIGVDKLTDYNIKFNTGTEFDFI